MYSTTLLLISADCKEKKTRYKRDNKVNNIYTLPASKLSPKKPKRACLQAMICTNIIYKICRLKYFTDLGLQNKYPALLIAECRCSFTDYFRLYHFLWLFLWIEGTCAEKEFSQSPIMKTLCKWPSIKWDLKFSMTVSLPFVTFVV